MDHGTKKLVEAVLENNELGYLKDNYLVEVFRIWDCYEQDWISNSPTLLRFESQDVIVRIDDEGMFETIVGPVDTSSAIEPSFLVDHDDECICWLCSER